MLMGQVLIGQPHVEVDHAVQSCVWGQPHLLHLESLASAHFWGAACSETRGPACRQLSVSAALPVPGVLALRAGHSWQPLH